MWTLVSGNASYWRQKVVYKFRDERIVEIMQVVLFSYIWKIGNCIRQRVAEHNSELNQSIWLVSCIPCLLQAQNVFFLERCIDSTRSQDNSDSPLRESWVFYTTHIVSYGALQGQGRVCFSVTKQCPFNILGDTCFMLWFPDLTLPTISAELGKSQDEIETQESSMGLCMLDNAF